MDSPETIETTLLFLEKNRIGYKRLLGSGVWSDRKVVERFRKKISKGITFFNDYSFSGSAIETVETAKSHQKLWNTALSSNFWYGYDTMDFLLHTIDKSPDLKHSELAKAIRNAPVYNAHYTKYRFEGNNVNHYLNVILIQPDTARQPNHDLKAKPFFIIFKVYNFLLLQFAFISCLTFQDQEQQSHYAHSSAYTSKRGLSAGYRPAYRKGMQNHL